MDQKGTGLMKNKSNELVEVDGEIHLLTAKIKLLKEKRFELIRKETKKSSEAFLKGIKETNDIGKEEIEILGLSARARNSLKNAGFETIESLLKSSEAELLKIKGFGYICLLELRDILSGINLYCGMHKPKI